MTTHGEAAILDAIEETRARVAFALTYRIPTALDLLDELSRLKAPCPLHSPEPHLGRGVQMPGLHGRPEREAAPAHAGALDAPARRLGRGHVPRRAAMPVSSGARYPSPGLSAARACAAGRPG